MFRVKLVTCHVKFGTHKAQSMISNTSSFLIVTTRLKVAVGTLTGHGIPRQARDETDLRMSARLVCFIELRGSYVPGDITPVRPHLDDIKSINPFSDHL